LAKKEQENHAIAKMTARCAQYVSALKIVGLCKRKMSRRLRKNLHITNLPLFGGAVKLFSKYSIQCDHGTYDLNVTHGQTDGDCGITAR